MGLHEEGTASSQLLREDALASNGGARAGPVLVVCSALRRVRGVNVGENRLDMT